MIRRLSRRAVGPHIRITDIAIAIGFAVIAFVEAAGHGDDLYLGTAPPVVGGVLAAVAALPLALRRRRPITAVAAIATLEFLPHLVVSYDAVFVGGFLALTVALEGAARYGRRPLNRIALVPPAVGLIGFSALLPGFAGQVVVYAAILLVGWALGVLLRALVERRGALERELAARETGAALRLEQAVTDERTRVARELHDVIAHCVSVMVLQAGAARLRMDFDPQGSADAIERIESTGRDALADLGRVLGLLHADPLDDSSASLAHLDALAAQVAGAGLQVSIRVEGDPATLPPALDRSLYRIAQEGLTNALKHGLDARADLRLTVGADRVAVEVQNAAAADRPARLPGGNGQTGMRERVAAFGGVLSTRLDSGHYELRAEIPLQTGIQAGAGR